MLTMRVESGLDKAGKDNAARAANGGLMMNKREHTKDGYCEDCGVAATLRTCDDCGYQMYVLNCGHMPQPTPIAAGLADGSDLHHDYCEDCAEIAAS